MLNYYPATPSPDQRVMFVSPIRFIFDGKYFASMMTSIKENAFEIEGSIYDILLPNFMPGGGLALPDFPGLFKKSSFKMADSQNKNSN